MSDTPTDNLVRALVAPEAATLRDDGPNGTAGRTLTGYFAVFNRWTEIDSSWEGRFLERIAPTAFDGVFADKRDQIKVLYDHGHDPQLGNKPLGSITELRADKVGAHYEVDLIRASYNDDFVIPAAQAGLLGASFRFKVSAEEWQEPKKASAHNPAMLPERTITEVDPLYEFGPVTFPAYPDGTKAGVRSLTDDHLDRLLHDPLFLARFTERAGLAVVERLLAKLPPTAEPPDDTTLPPPERSDEDEHEEDERPTASEYIPTPRPRLSLEALREQRAAIEELVGAATRTET
jgi:hypothetical protein